MNESGRGRLRLLVRVLPFLVIAGAAGLGVRLLFGDGLGPLERGIRAALGGWDMWNTAAVTPYEQPLFLTPAGIVPADGGEPGYAGARRALEEQELPAAELRARAARVWVQACRHCHGENGDGRIIVGESFAFTLPDLRSPEVQRSSDATIYDRVTRGFGRMLPLASILTPAERVLSVAHMRTLPGRPSVPFFPPRWTDPAEQPGGP